jgi:hypothetical protein
MQKRLWPSSNELSNIKETFLPRPYLFIKKYFKAFSRQKIFEISKINLEVLVVNNKK